MMMEKARRGTKRVVVEKEEYNERSETTACSELKTSLVLPKQGIREEGQSDCTAFSSPGRRDPYTQSIIKVDRVDNGRKESKTDDDDARSVSSTTCSTASRDK